MLILEIKLFIITPRHKRGFVFLMAISHTFDTFTLILALQMKKNICWLLGLFCVTINVTAQKAFTVGVSNTTNYTDMSAQVIISTSDGGYAIAGHLIGGPGLIAYSAFIMKVDSSGNEQWTKYYLNYDAIQSINTSNLKSGLNF